MRINLLIQLIVGIGALNIEVNGQIQHQHHHHHPVMAMQSRFALRNDPSYVIIASKLLRPGSVYALSISLLKAAPASNIKAYISCDGIEISSANKVYEPGDTDLLLLKIPPTSVPGAYTLRVEGNANDVLYATFNHTAELQLAERFLTIIIHLNRPVYNCYSKVLIRVLVFTLDMKPHRGSVNINILDPKGYVMTGFPSVQLNSGVGTASYVMPEYSATGWWSVQVDAFGQVEEKQYLVEKFDIPKFEVYVFTPEFILSHQQIISGTMIAIYGSNSYIRGNATIQIFAEEFGESDGPREFLLEEILDPFSGSYEFEYALEDLHSNVRSLFGKVLKIEVLVWDQLMNLKSSGYGSIYVMKSRLQLTFLGSRNKVFKPGMPFRTHISISYDNAVKVSEERLSQSILTVQSSFIMANGDRKLVEIINDRFDEEGVLPIEIDTPVNAQYLILHAVYEDSELQANTELLATAYTSYSNRSIYVHTSSSPAEMGNYAIIHVRADFYLESFVYVVISKGLILYSGKESMEILFRPIKTLSIAVSSEMAPSFRVLVYHVTLDGQVIADSINIPVKSINTNEFKVHVSKAKDKTGNTVEMGVIGPAGGVVGFAVQDVDTFCHKCGADLTPATVLENLYDYDDVERQLPSTKWIYPDLTPDKISHYDSSDWSSDDVSTFMRAGMVIITDANVPEPTDRCNLIPGLLSCMNGACYPQNGTCDGIKQCSNGFDEMSCNYEMDWDTWKKFRIYRRSRVGQFFDISDGDWGWTEFNTDIFDFKSFPVPNRPSNWIIFAFRTDSKTGLDILEEPIYLAGVRPFFINVDMPTYCRQGEQIGIRIDAFNNEPQGIYVTFALLPSDDYKFIHVEELGYVRPYDPRTSSGEHQLHVWIKPNSISTVYFPIAMNTVGEIDVTVEARTGVAKDSASFTVVVVPGGFSQSLHTSVLLDLKTQPQVLKFLNINVTETPIIPYTQWRLFLYDSPNAQVSVVGDVFGPSFHSMPATVDLLVKKPEQAAEAIAFSFGVNLWMVHYLRLTNQLTKSVLSEALVQLNYYYAYLMMFQNQDGSFSMWKGREPNVWVTAAVARVFQQSRFSDWENDLAVDPKIIVEAMEWLVNQQSDDGGFIETSQILFNPRMQPKSPFYNRNPRLNNIPLTAFVLITLCEVSNTPGDVRVHIASARARATRFLEKRVLAITDPYDMAIVTYALTLASSVEGEMAFLRLDKMKKEQEGCMYWSPETAPMTEVYLDNQRLFLQAHRPFKADALSVEATAYALLVYVAREGLLQENIVRWLNMMRTTDGGFLSTQDTLVALQALTEFSFRARLRDITDLRVRVRASSGDLEETLTVNDQNLAELQTLQVPNVWGHIEVIARGSGMAILQLDVSYSIDYSPLLIPPAENAFDLTLQATFSGRNNSYIHVTTCQRWTLLDVAPTSGLAVFEMDLPTGYYQYQPVWDAFVDSNQVANLRNLYVTQTKVYAFFQTLGGDYTCLNFTLERWWPVANLSNYIKAKVYDYYSPELYKEVIFDTYTLYMLDVCQVCGSYQCPYCYHYSHAQICTVNIALIILCTMLSLDRSILRIFTKQITNYSKRRTTDLYRRTTT